MDEMNNLILEAQTLIEKQRLIMREMYRIINSNEPELDDDGLIKFV